MAIMQDLTPIFLNISDPNISNGVPINKESRKFGPFLASVVAGTAFWGLDAFLVVVLSRESFTTLLIRNVVLIGFSMLWLSARLRRSMFGLIRVSALPFVVALWISGAATSAGRSLVVEQSSLIDAAFEILVFPMTTLEVATYSGILPALLLSSLLPLLKGIKRGVN